jgi:NAD(P)-dependent dehydrogenase (short-subunit alcohol dehydrogenase family)
VNNAGIFRTKPFTDFTTQDFNALVSTNLLGFLYITQLTVKQMLKPKSGNVVSITAALVDQPVAGVNASVSMITKGGLNAVIRSLAIEYAKEGIRFNAVAPGVVDSPLHKDDPKDSLKKFQPMGENRGDKRSCRRCPFPGTSRSSNRRNTPRGWWLSRWPLVVA